jgi:hypothetical protein
MASLRQPDVVMTLGGRWTGSRSVAVEDLVARGFTTAQVQGNSAMRPEFPQPIFFQLLRPG